MSTDLVLFFNKAPTHVRELRVDEATWPPFYLIDTTGQANSRGAIQCCRISEYLLSLSELKFGVISSPPISLNRSDQIRVLQASSPGSDWAQSWELPNCSPLVAPWGVCMSGITFAQDSMRTPSLSTAI